MAPPFLKPTSAPSMEAAQCSQGIGMAPDGSTGVLISIPLEPNNLFEDQNNCDFTYYDRGSDLVFLVITSDNDESRGIFSLSGG